jgi:hypothetical protein
VHDHCREQESANKGLEAHGGAILP